MVWGVEKVVPSALGRGLSGYDVARGAAASGATAPARHHGARALHPRHRRAPQLASVHSRARPRQQPLGPAPARADAGAARERRARILAVPRPYYVNEEEVPRAGKIVTRGYQRARWLDGATFVWIGRRVTTGRGEGSSGLAFDQVVDTPRSGV